jgi:hypothetical protein
VIYSCGVVGKVIKTGSRMWLPGLKEGGMRSYHLGGSFSSAR